MKFECRVEIDQPRDKVVKLFDNPENYPHWQIGFKRLEHVSGTANQKGARAKIFLEQGKGEMELLETITEKDLPRLKCGRYEHKHMSNTMLNRFKEIDEGRTEYVAEIEYTQFNGLLPTLMAKLFPGMFRRQTQAWLDKFKSFAESQ